jgi:hypothetical protein
MATLPPLPRRRATQTLQEVDRVLRRLQLLERPQLASRRTRGSDGRTPREEEHAWVYMPPGAWFYVVRTRRYTTAGSRRGHVQARPQAQP